MRRVCTAWFLLLAAPALAEDVDILVNLTSPLGTNISHRGDPVSARVVRPQALQGDAVEGHVKESRAGGKFGGKSVLNFSFDTLRHGGQAIPISAQVESITNSKGQTDVDEEGRVVHRSTANWAKAAGGTGFGALIGGLAGGGKGAAIGAAAGAAASVVLIEVAAQGPSIRFDAGSRVLLSAKSRSGPLLSSLKPNAAPATPQSVVPAPNPTAGPAAATVAPAAAPVPAAAASAPAAPGQPDLTAVKADFIPGDKTIFYDDFTDMTGDEPPPHWKVRGTVAELQVGNGIRQLAVKGETVTLTPNLTGLPKNFTMEADLTIGAGDPGTRPENGWHFLTKGGGDALLVYGKQEAGKEWYLKVTDGAEQLGEATLPVDWSQMVKLALWVQNGRLRLYVNGQRIFDVNQVNLPDIASVEDRLWTGQKTVGYRFVRFAESAPDFGQVISTSGRYVTHGILFDTDSDRLKPESAPVIKLVASGLQTNPNLSLRIEGYTDPTGNADHNLDLSKRRAEAVKTVLVSQFGIDTSRLTSAGMGAAKPIDTNDTPQGRAQNRRVEFVRQ
jgi:OOP family OmpA-OmpF porin